MPTATKKRTKKADEVLDIKALKAADVEEDANNTSDEPIMEEGDADTDEPEIDHPMNWAPAYGAADKRKVLWTLPRSGHTVWRQDYLRTAFLRGTPRGVPGSISDVEDHVAALGFDVPKAVITSTVRPIRVLLPDEYKQVRSPKMSEEKVAKEPKITTLTHPESGQSVDRVDYMKERMLGGVAKAKVIKEVREMGCKVSTILADRVQAELVEAGQLPAPTPRQRKAAGEGGDDSGSARIPKAPKNGKNATGEAAFKDEDDHAAQKSDWTTKEAVPA